jgi:hypothetical protein
MPIKIRYGDKNGVLSQQLAGVLYGNRCRVWGVMRIDTVSHRRERRQEEWL